MYMYVPLVSTYCTCTSSYVHTVHVQVVMYIHYVHVCTIGMYILYMYK